MGSVVLVDVDAGGTARVSVLREGDLPTAPVEVPTVAWPLSETDLEDLAWYLESYVSAPFAVYEDRGSAVAAGLDGWGERVFAAVFGSGAARDALVALRAAGGPVEVVVRSDAPGMLGLPWELMKDPDRPSPVVLDGMRVSRSLPTSGTEEAFAVGGERMRVLMVISRPRGASDVAYQMIARPLVQRLELVRGEVQLVVLRPPTLEALIAELARARAAGAPFQVVHFDGHGALARTGGSSGRSVSFRGGDESGTLVFEKPRGGPDPIDAEKVAEVLAEAGVPVVVLNACQSGAVGKDLEAAVATRLLKQGTRAVVAMAYTVYATAAAEFMTAFYDRLFSGDTLTAAVAAGRARMARNNLRHSPKGLIPLQDWVVPVHYKRSDVAFPYLATTEDGVASIDDLLDAALTRDTGSPPEEQGDEVLAPVGEFVGRDDLFFAIEAALQHRRGVVLHGPGGTGKTELAKAFSRWAAATGGVEDPRYVVWHSFEPGVATFGLDGVVNSAGARLFGTGFHALDPAARLDLVTQVLAEHRVLMVWDNFETVHSMPDPDRATPPLDDAERQRLASFLRTVNAGAGKSMVIVTSRTREDWLGDNLVGLDVGGLLPDEAVEYADQILSPLPIPPGRRQDRAFAELLDWLDGHPLSMRLTLPHLSNHTARDILNELMGATDTAGLLGGSAQDVDAATRATSLTASVTYSYRHLSGTTTALLPAVALFQGVTDAGVLAAFSQADTVPDRFAGTTREEWGAVLDQAAGVGLLTRLGAGMYRIHPALPAYLTALWRAGVSDDYQRQRDAADTALLHAYAALGGWLLSQVQAGDAGLAFALIRMQRGTMARLLSLALERGAFEYAQAILQPLDEYLDTQGAQAEQDTWTDRIRLATEDTTGTPPNLDTPAGALWLFTVGGQANRQNQAGLRDEAETTFRTILGVLQDQEPTNEVQLRLATVHHQLGTVAQDRGDLNRAEDWFRKSLTSSEELGRPAAAALSLHHLGMVSQERGDLDQAEEWYRKSLTIRKNLGDRRGAATSYHQLGWVAQDQGDLELAEQLYRESLTIEEELENRPGAATSYHQLGIVAQRRGDLDQAEEWYRKSLTIGEELGDRRGAARSYHQLGMVAQARGDLDQAEQWYQKSLTIEEELQNRLGAASSYIQLGIVAQVRGHLDEAEGWYRKSLTITEEFGNRPGMAMTYGAMGLLALESGSLHSALAWVVRAVALFDSFPHPAAGISSAYLALLTAQLGEPALAEVWQEVTGRPLPGKVRAYVRNATQPPTRTQEENMDPAVGQGARATAARLSGTFGADLPAQVEAELHATPDTRPGQYLDPVSLGALIVSIASLAWTIYEDTRKPDQPGPAPEVVARTVRVRLDQPTDLPAKDRARLIEVTVEETLRHVADKG